MSASLSIVLKAIKFQHSKYNEKWFPQTEVNVLNQQRMQSFSTLLKANDVNPPSIETTGANKPV